MALIGWVDPEDETHQELLAELFPDSVGLSDEALAHYLKVAHEQCWTYLNHKPDPAELPARFVQAQIVQARALRRSGLVGEGEQVGADGMALPVWPLDRTIKALLRPRSGKPSIR